MLLHATAVEKHGQACLLCGPSGAGKSDLALRLLDRGFRLISDDQTVLRITPENSLTAEAADKIRGMIEAYGVGILTLEPSAWTPGPIPVKWQFDLGEVMEIARMPAPRYVAYGGCNVKSYRLNAFEASVVLKIERLMLGQSMPAETMLEESKTIK